MKPIICIMVALFGPTLQHDTRCRKVFCDHFGASAVTNLDGYGALGPFVGNKRNLAIYNQGRYLFFGWIYFATNCIDCVQNFCFATEKVKRGQSRELIQRWTDLIRTIPNAPLFGSARQQPSIFSSQARAEQGPDDVGDSPCLGLHTPLSE